MSTPDLVSVLQRYVLAGFRLQLALRLVLAAFLGTTLVIETAPAPVLAVHPHPGRVPGNSCAMGGVGVHPTAPARGDSVRASRFCLADVTVVGALTAITGIASPHEWTSDVLSQGLFLIPIIAAAQLSAPVSAIMAVPTLLSFVVANWLQPGRQRGALAADLPARGRPGRPRRRFSGAVLHSGVWSAPDHPQATGTAEPAARRDARAGDTRERGIIRRLLRIRTIGFTGRPFIKHKSEKRCTSMLYRIHKACSRKHLIAK